MSAHEHVVEAGPDDRLGTASYLQLGEYGGDVVADGRRRQAQSS